MIEWQYIVGIGIGFLAGFINVFAGGGSLLTLPFLIFMGLPATVANGTNRVALLMQNIVATGSFKQMKVFRFREGIYLTIPAIAGAIPGAFLASNIDQQLMEKLIGGLLVIMFLMVLIKPERWLKPAGSEKTKIGLAQIITFFFIGLYGGFIQAGIGFFLIAALIFVAGADLIKANALKLFVVLIYNLFAFAVFILHDQVDFLMGAIVGVGNMLGAYLATRIAVRSGPRLARIILLAGLLLSALNIFDVIDIF